jgi:hypothetical protein
MLQEFGLKCDMADKLHFKGNDPGAVSYGNFINYYKFNSAENRLELLPTDLWNVKADQSFVCLDIGCNSGVNICFLTILTYLNALNHEIKSSGWWSIFGCTSHKQPRDGLVYLRYKPRGFAVIRLNRLFQPLICL